MIGTESSFIRLLRKMERLIYCPLIHQLCGLERFGLFLKTCLAFVVFPATFTYLPTPHTLLRRDLFAVHRFSGLQTCATLDVSSPTPLECPWTYRVLF